MANDAHDNAETDRLALERFNQALRDADDEPIENLEAAASILGRLAAGTFYDGTEKMMPANDKPTTPEPTFTATDTDITIIDRPNADAFCDGPPDNSGCTNFATHYTANRRGCEMHMLVHDPDNVLGLNKLTPADVMKRTDTIDLTPTPYAYRNIAGAYIRTLYGNFKPKDADTAREMLRALCEVMLFLGNHADAPAHKASVMREFDTPGG